MERLGQPYAPYAPYAFAADAGPKWYAALEEAGMSAAEALNVARAAGIHLEWATPSRH